MFKICKYLLANILCIFRFLKILGALLIDLFNCKLQILWTFSIYLESVAILPQLFMMSKTGEAETITSHYLFALGKDVKSYFCFNFSCFLFITRISSIVINNKVVKKDSKFDMLAAKVISFVIIPLM